MKFVDVEHKLVSFEGEDYEDIDEIIQISDRTIWDTKFMGCNNYCGFDVDGSVYMQNDYLMRVIMGDGRGIRSVECHPYYSFGFCYDSIYNVFILYLDGTLEHHKTRSESKILANDVENFTSASATNNSEYLVTIFTYNGELKLLHVDDHNIVTENIKLAILTHVRMCYMAYTDEITFVDDDNKVWMMQFDDEPCLEHKFGYKCSTDDIYEDSGQKLALLNKIFKSPIVKICSGGGIGYTFLLENGDVYCNSFSDYDQNDLSTLNQGSQYNPGKIPFGVPIEQISVDDTSCTGKDFKGNIICMSYDYQDTCEWVERKCSGNMPKALALPGYFVDETRFSRCKRSCH